MKKLFALAILSAALSAHADQYYVVKVTKNDVDIANTDPRIAMFETRVGVKPQPFTMQLISRMQNACNMQIETFLTGIDFNIQATGDAVTIDYDLRHAESRNMCDTLEVKKIVGQKILSIPVGATQQFDADSRTITVERLEDNTIISPF